MIEDLNGMTSQLVKIAIDGAMQKHKVILNNIANSKSEGYKPLVSIFELELNKLSGDLNDFNKDIDSSDVLNNMKQRLVEGKYINESSNEKINIDIEMAKMSQNVIRYKALIEGLNKYGQITKMAIRQEAIR